MKIELLSPAKDKETAFAAIDCGADAVYIGAPAFGARKAVPNSIEDIKEVVNYAHKFWAKVYVALNTILTDTELEKAVELAQKLDRIGVDALIIQDLGLLNRLMGLKLPINLHISTQCDNYLPQKIKFFNDLGISRVVLARELSIEQIKQIHEENPDLELEAFVHGALCVSMSGQCYLSQYIGGRSANRGECAQPCRKTYNIETTDGKIIKKDIHALCLKDFNASNCLNEMIEAGVCSFKIEGRLKDIGYVKNITAYYAEKLAGRKSSSGKSIYPFIPNPEKSFNRGFTEYFIKGRSDCFNFESPKSRGEYLGKVVEVKKDCFKIETDKEIHPQDGLYFGGDGFKVNKSAPVEGLCRENVTKCHVFERVPQRGISTQSAPLAGEVPQRGKGGYYWIYPNKKINLKPGVDIYRNYDSEFEKELLKPVKRQIGVSIEITPLRSFGPLPPQGGQMEGEMSFESLPQQKGADECAIPPQGGQMLIELTDEDGVTISEIIPEGEKPKNPERMKETFVKQFSKTGESDFYIKDIKIASELPFLPVSEINKLRRELFEELMNKRLAQYKRGEQKPLKYTPYYLKEVDYRANVHNSSAKEFYKKCGVNVLEPSFETRKPERQIELMRCKHCIKYALNMCKSPENLILKDSSGKSYPLKFNCKSCEMSVLS